ncbi:hypothetical protein LTR10_016469 [Elasticomyces elasticus]|uniref:Major facilitator superfamily (MFS) profile domain-containing protein n=1 Tax=Exophiala sideris TaxID=1016849 RepID=A0ABR0JBQ8_9EURO|nr:hypothetical protein LTR10_016469 [Elasticomyces elasticus]KAK5031143.1 hypothetical protein LTS07_004878 [Exophiala sideris]KAK5038864.1 hypothetical protein LTR13_003895 [Exophiala sideris]KAK5060748.1 hypothetical protein LTR69_005347 [Exophiala sideris]KAK5183660.1 hypothetical protein LTR44_003942 [Eurotiomycetes sp. CCFEE 6388]
MSSDRLPPGTQRIEDQAGSKILLAPQPNADPNQPLNWSAFRKTVHMTILCLYALMVFAILCVAVPLWQDFNEELGMSYAVLNDGYATNMATLSVGCIIFVPIALRLGRRPIYLITALVMLAGAIWQAKMYTVGDMIGSNAITGLAGAVNEAIFQVTVADLFYVHQRGTMNGIYLAVVIVGNYLGPVAAGYVAVNQNWRWVFWYCTIFMSVVTLIMVVFLEETKYTPRALIGREVVDSTHQESDLTKVDSMTKDTAPSISVDATEAATNNRRRVVEIDSTIPMDSYWRRHRFWSTEKVTTTESRSLWMHLYQPFQILCTFPAVMFCALQYGFLIAMLAVLAVTQADLYPFPPYNFSPIGIGNLNIAPAVGAILGSMFGGPLNDYFILQVAKRRGGIYEPETRLWLFLIPGFCMPLGLFLYGLTIAKGMNYWINIVGSAFIGAAIGGCGDIALTYCQDCYQYILGDALTSVVFVRNVISTALVFAITPWIEGMGVYNMFVLLGCLSIAIALTCVPLIIWGRAWRIKLAPRYEHFVAKQY